VCLLLYVCVMQDGEGEDEGEDGSSIELGSEDGELVSEFQEEEGEGTEGDEYETDEDDDGSFNSAEFDAAFEGEEEDAENRDQSE